MRDKFQPNFDVIPLYDENNPLSDVIKVGVLPFLPGSGPDATQVLLMRPRAKPKHVAPPSFQIAKGTRLIHIDGHARDMGEADLQHDPSLRESLLETALREGHEEVGLKADNIKRAFDMGVYLFTSESTGKTKKVHMFAAEIANKDTFDAYEPSTVATLWVTREEMEARIDSRHREPVRRDHAEIVEDILARLAR
jgi:8-oxo-dGTP pyrophosphatase MutT (NUDIX family)